jgi:membrane-associated phospholipid phosphatase
MTTSWAAFLQKFSTPWLDQLMYLITSMGSELFYIIVLPVLYWTWSKRAGYRMGMFYLFGAYLNSVLKVAFHIPRPVPTADARVMHPETGPGYAFPSGHAQGATVFWGQRALELRTRAAWVTAAVITVLVSMSRIYLNVHWPSDVAGGILIGVALLVVLNLLSGLWERLDLPVPVRILACLALAVAAYLLYREDDAYILIGFLLGFPAGRILEETYVGWTERARFRANVLKVVVGLAGLIILRYGLKAVFPETAAADIARYAIVGLWGSLGAPLVFVRMGWHR